MPDSAPRKLNWLLLLLVGATYSLISLFASAVWRTEDLQRATELWSRSISTNPSLFVTAGLTWLLLGFALRSMPTPLNATGWIRNILIAFVAYPPVAYLMSFVTLPIFTNGALPRLELLFTEQYWSSVLLEPPANVLGLIRSALLVFIAQRGTTKAAAAAVWSPGTLPSFRSTHATRLLCGSACLNGRLRDTILSSVRDKHTAVAPEYGVDIRLLIAVCLFMDRRANRFALGFAGIVLAAIAAIGLLSDIIPLETLVLVAAAASAVLWAWRWFGDRAFARTFERSYFTIERATERFGSYVDDNLVRSLPLKGQNLIVYKGFLPFVGSGIDLDGWSFVTFIDKAKAEGGKDRIKAFTIDELSASVTAALRSAVPDLECEDVFFARGIDVRNDTYILPDFAEPPRQNIPAELVPNYTTSDQLVRCYKRIQTINWGGEIITTSFFRCIISGNALYIEFRRFLLPPIASQYRTIDTLGDETFSSILGLILASAIIGPIYSILACFIVLGHVQEGFANIFGAAARNKARRRKEIQHDLSFDCGAQSSLRATFSQPSFMHYFQKIDTDARNKIIERQILEEIERFLDAHGIDTRDLRDRQTTILNSGILVQGGDVRAESLAVGTGAQATKVEHQRGNSPVGAAQ